MTQPVIEAFFWRFGPVLWPFVGDRLRERPDPRDVLPYVSARTVSRVPGQTLDGEDGEPFCRIQVDVWTTTAGEGDAIADALRGALKADGKALPVRWGFLTITDVQTEEAGRPTEEEAGDGSGSAIWQTSLDVGLNFLEG